MKNYLPNNTIPYVFNVIKCIQQGIQYGDGNFTNLGRAIAVENNSYGFNFDCNKLGIDKLRTLYLGEKKFSLNQNG